MKRVIALLLVLVLLTGCSISTRSYWKNVKADFGKGMTREIVVTDVVTGETVWSYRGYCYIKDESQQGDVTIMYDTDTTPRKIDFIGYFNVRANEI